MKKNLLVCLALSGAIFFTGCKSKESDYKKAYEKAKAEEMARQTTPVAEVSPVATSVTMTPVTKETPTRSSNQPVEENVKVKTERLDVLNGGTLKVYNVVCGSFSKPENANNLRNTLVNAGYTAQVAQNPENNMYRVIASSFDDKSAAVRSRNELRSKYPDAWILLRSY